MAINDFVRRSMQIVAGGIKDSTVDYFDNAITFVNDAKEIKDQVMQGARSSKETFDNMRHAGIGKKFRDWFYNEGGMFGDFDFSDEDFDAGFEIDSADNDSKESSKPLTQDDMQDVAKKQTGAIYKALGKTADLHMANTAEIISTINSRSAELTASVNNINNTLIQIGKRLDMIVEYTAARTKQEQKEERKNSIFDYGGGISVSGLATGLKENMNDSMAMSMLSMGKTMLSSGMVTPEMVLSMVLSQTVLDKKFKGLGDKSINDIGEALNDTIGNAIQDGLTKVLTTKNDFLSEIFGDIINGPGKKNFRDFAQNQYNDKPAVFDGMTRKSIVTIIPGYLNEILKAVSHTDGMSIDKKGNLTSKKTDHFINEVADNLFKPGSIDHDRRNKILTTAKAYDANISSSDISEAMRALTGAWLWYMYQTGRQVLEVGETTDITRESTQRVIQNASILLSTQTGRSSDYWKEILQYCIFQLDESSFRRELQKNNQKAFKNLSDFAKNRDNNSQARSIGKQEILDAYKRQFSMYHSEPGKAYEPPSPATVTETSVGSSKSTTLGSLDYLSGIFKILNRGLNVYVTGSSRRQKKAYDPIDIKPGDGYVSSIGNLPSVNNNTDITPTQQPTSSTSPLIESDSVKKEPETEEEKLLATPDDELSPEDRKRKKKLMKEKVEKGSKGLWGSAKGFFNDLINGNHTLKGSVYMPFLDMLDKQLPGSKDKINSAVQSVKESELGQSVANSEAVKKGKELGSTVSNKILGEKTTDESGNTTRTGGILSSVVNGASKIKSDVVGVTSNIGNNIADKFASKEELQNRFTNATKPYMDESTTFASAEDREDQNTVKILNMTVQTAISDNEYSSVDESEVTGLINRLHDPKLKQQMKRSIVPLLEKQGKKMEGIESDKPKSGIGKFIGLALVGIKKIFGPVVKIIRSGVTKIFSLVKNFGKKLFSLIGKSVKSGFQKMYYGAKSFGSGVSGLFKSMTSGIGKRLSKMMGQFDKIKNKWSEYQEKRQERKQSQSSEKTDDSEEGEKEGILSRTRNKLSDAADKVRDKMRQSEFGKGFLEAHDNRKKANLRDKAPETVGDQAAVDIRTATEDIEDVINNETDEGKGFTKPIIKVLNNIIEAIKGSKESEQEGEITTDTDADSDKVQDPDEKQKNSSVQMDDLDMNAKSTDLGSSGNASKTEAPQMADISESSGANNAGGDGKKKGGIMNSIGKMVGGISSMMGGLLQVVLSIVMSLEGFKAIYDLIMNTLTTSLKPLNQAFQSIMKVLKPFIKEIGSIVKMISGFIVQLVNTVVDIVKPILEDVVKPVLDALMPLLDIIIQTLSPILSLIGIILKVVLAPFLGIFKYTLVPIIKIIGDAVQIIMGVLQIGFGVLMMGIGGIIAGIGGIISLIGKIPGLGAAGNLGSSILDSGKSMLKQGADFTAQGAKSVGQGAVNLALDYASMYSLGLSDKVIDSVKDKIEEKKEVTNNNNKDVIQDTYANGDTNTYIYNTYGGEYQRGMGGYLNMDQRGCGPIALADAYNRRGGNLSARSLAASMAGSGAYDPNRGTSVGSFLSTSKSLGMNVRAGGVTQQSLKLATPNNPITVIGSGSDYGTRRGNNHFMNVIGTDSHGGAYVSNPLTGRVDRKPASTIAGSAVAGIYGAGDEADGGYSFPDAVKEAFKALKEQANKVLGLFSMEKSDEEEIGDIINEEQNKNALDQAKRTLGDEEYAKYEKEARDAAYADYVKAYPKRDGQSDEEYQEAFEKWYSTRSAKYLAETKLMDAAKEKSDNGWQTLANTTQSFVDNYADSENGLFAKLGDAYTDLNSNISSMSNSSGSGYFTSNEGVPLWTPYSDNIEITDTDIDQNNYHSPLFEFFAKTMGMSLGSVYGSSWFAKRNNPNKQGQGSSGDEHSGVDFTGGSIEGKPLYATTGGKVVLSHYQGDGGGNMLVWQDSAGKYHWYMHMAEPSTFKVGDEISGGDLIGYVGSTGASTGPHLHYTINDSTSSSGSGNVYNPLMYFNNYNPTGGNYGMAVGSTDEERIYSYLTTSGMTPIGASGLMGCFKYESDMKTNNLENSYNDQFGLSDDEYTKRVDSGEESEDQFVTGRNATAWSGQTPGEAVGYGIAQFTSSNLKRDLYNKTVKQGKSISTLESQLDAIQDVLKERGIYDTINNAKTPTDANKTFAWKYEFGTNYNSDEAVLRDYSWLSKTNPDGTVLRHQYAEAVYDKFKNWSVNNATKSPTGSGSTLTGYGMVNSAADAKLVENNKQTQNTSGKAKGIVYTNQGDPLNIRSSMSISSDPLGLIPNGTEIEVEASGNGDWYKVTYDGKTGYVSSDYIRILTTDADNADFGKNVYKYTGTINSPSDLKYSQGVEIDNGSSPVTFKNYSDTGTKTNSGSTNTNTNKQMYDSGDPRYYKTSNGNYKFDDRIFTNNDPRWRSVWYNEYYDPDKHTDQEMQTGYDMLAHMQSLATNPNVRNSRFYNEGLKQYGDKDILMSTVNMSPDLGTGDGWKAERQDYVNKWNYNAKKEKEKRYNSPFTEDLMFLHNTFYPNNKLTQKEIDTLVGTGDVTGSMGYDYFSQDTIPDIDFSKFDSEDYGSIVPNVVNRYNIVRTDDSVKEEQIRAILQNTYNVRSESIESLLMEILEYLKKKDPKGTNNGTNGSTKLFDERIPAQVAKLSVG